MSIVSHPPDQHLHETKRRKRAKMVHSPNVSPAQEETLVSFLRDEANRATQAARQELNENGIGYVVAEDGKVVEKRELG
jgi:hypothetical protein